MEHLFFNSTSIEIILFHLDKSVLDYNPFCPQNLWEVTNIQNNLQGPSCDKGYPMNETYKGF